jgi:alanine racemase
MNFPRTASSLLALMLLTACHTTAPLPTPTAQNAHAWLEISEPAFEHNLAEMKKLVGPHIQICAVMKADAYGHGIALLIPAISEASIPYVGITSKSCWEASFWQRTFPRWRTGITPFSAITSR